MIKFFFITFGVFFLFLKDCFALTSLNDVLSCSVSISAYVSSVDTYGERSSRSMNGSAFSLDFLTPETYKNRRYFVTAYHVVANASSVKVILQDVQERVDDEADLTKYQFDATVEYFDQESDIAILAVQNIQKKNQQKISSFCKDSSLERSPDAENSLQKQLTIIGNKLNFHNTISQGYISGFRKIESSDIFNSDVNYIQIDANISYGNSGSIVLNRTTNKIVGMVTSSAELDDSSTGVSFVIPFSHIESFTKQSFLTVEGIFGFKFDDLKVGQKVDDWPKDYPFIDFEKNDKVLFIDTAKIYSPAMLRKIMTSLDRKKVDTIKVTVLRGDKKIILPIKYNK